MTEAIEKDVTVKENFKTEHDKAYEDLIARRAAEGKVEPAPEPEPEPEPSPPEDPSPEPEPAKTISFVDDGGNIINVPVTAKYKAKIDGNDVETPIENITRSYQKGAAADRRLEEATRKLKELSAKESDLTKREQEYKSNMEALEAKKEDGKLSDDAFRKTAQKLLNALTDSETPEDDLVNVLRDLGTPQTPEVDEDKIVAKALSKVEEKRIEKQKAEVENRRIEANKQFETDYQDIIGDPVAYNACKAIANDKFHSGIDAMDAIKEAAEEVRAWKVKLSPPKRQGREKPKATPKTASATAKVGEDKKPQTRTDILNEMRQSRGQPV